MNFADFSLLWLRFRQWLKNFSVIMFLLGLLLGASFGGYAFWSADPDLAEAKRSASVSPAPTAAPTAALALFNEANTLREKGACAEALPLYKRLLQEDPGAIGVLNNLALCQTELGQPEAARRTLEQAINAQSMIKVTHDNLTRVYAHLANLSYQKVKTGIDIRRYANEKTSDSPITAPSLMAMQSMNGEEATTITPVVVAQAALAEAPTKPASSIPASSKPNVVEQTLTLPVETVVAPKIVEKPMVVKPMLPEPTVDASKSLPTPKVANNIKVEKVDNVVNREIAKVSPIQSQPQAEKAGANVVANVDAKAAESLTSKNQTTAIYRALQDWANAWSNKNLNQYFASYASRFVPSDAQSLSDWRNDRIGKIAGKHQIEVRLSQFKFSPTANSQEMLVSFSQKYQSDGIKLSARKQVRMIYEGKRWKILEENVK